MTTKNSGVGLNRGIYESPYDAFTNYMNILGDFIKRVDSLYPVDIDNEELNVAAMLISLVIFFVSQKTFPNPAKKAVTQSVTYTAEEKAAMAKEIKQRTEKYF